MKVVKAAVVKHMEFPNRQAVQRYLMNLRVDGKAYEIISDQDDGDKCVLVILESWRNAVFMKNVAVM